MPSVFLDIKGGMPTVSQSSVRLFHLAAACHCRGFAAVGPVARRSIAARRLAAAAPQHGAQQQIWGAARCQLT